MKDKDRRQSIKSALQTYDEVGNVCWAVYFNVYGRPLSKNIR